MTESSAGKKLRILAIHRYYWPDTPPYASMLRSIAGRWARDGHKVEIFSTQPSYKPDAGIPRQAAVEVIDDVRIRRIALLAESGRLLIRLANILLFTSGILRYALTRGRFDVIMASTAPPVLTGAAARWAARLTGAKFVYHCMDIHPEIGRISGEFSNPLVYSALQRIDARNCRKASRVIVLSRDMEQALRLRQSCREARIEIINNFNLPAFLNDGKETMPAGLEKKDGIFRVLFAGNIGRFQGLETAIDAMHLLSDRKDIELLLLGEGRAVEELKSRAGSMLGDTIHFFPHQPIEVAKAVIRFSDLCLVSLTPGIYRYAFPSKTMTCLGEGRPLLVSIEQDSELADLVHHEGVGLAVPPSDAAAMAEAIVALADDPGRHDEMTIQARDAGQRLFGEQAVLERWSCLAQDIANEA